MLREDILLGCAITEKENQSRSNSTPLSLAKLTVFPDIKLQKCLLGHRDERRLLASPVFQHWIEFCKTHSEIRLQAIEVEQLSHAELEERRRNNQNTMSNNCNTSSSSGRSSGSIVVSASPPTTGVAVGSSSSSSTSPANKRSKVENLLRPLSLGKFLGRDKNYVATEVEDSIIFLTKSDLEKIEAQKKRNIAATSSQVSIPGAAVAVEQPLPTPLSSNNTNSEKMKVFEQEKRGSWFSDRKGGGKSATKTKSFTSYDMVYKKLTANDRYSDMSKMLEERFGDLSMATLMRGNVSRQMEGAATKGNRSSSVTDVSAVVTRERVRETGQQRMTGNGGGGGSRYSLNKTFSLENISLYDLQQPRSRHSFSPSTSQTPDLVRIINHSQQRQQQRMSSAASSVENIGRLYPTTSSQCLSSTGTTPSSPPRDEASFISEKLYNEFHVKTKLHSKSSTHLNRWPFQARQRSSTPLRKTSSIMNIATDCSSSSVQDLLSAGAMDTSAAPSLVVVPQSQQRITILHRAPKDVTREFINTNTEYFAEICNGQNSSSNNNNHTSRTQIVNVL